MQVRTRAANAVQMNNMNKAILAISFLTLCTSHAETVLPFEKITPLPINRNSLLSVHPVGNSPLFLLTGKMKTSGLGTVLFSAAANDAELKPISTAVKDFLFVGRVGPSTSDFVIFKNDRGVFLDLFSELLDNAGLPRKEAIKIDIHGSPVAAQVSGNAILMLANDTKNKKFFVYNFSTNGQLNWMTQITSSRAGVEPVAENLFLASGDGGVLIGWLTSSGGMPGLSDVLCELAYVSDKGKVESRLEFKAFDFAGQLFDGKLHLFIRTGDITGSALRWESYTPKLSLLGRKEIAKINSLPTSLLNFSNAKLGPCLLFKPGVNIPFSIFSSATSEIIQLGSNEVDVELPFYAAANNNNLLVFGVSRKTGEQSEMALVTFQLPK
jgi:hypothetical protein